MKRLRVVLLGALGVLFVGQGCLSAPTAPTTAVAPSPQPLTVVPAKDGRLTTREILGMTVPTTDLATFKDTTTEKQDGVVYIGQSYRLTASAEEYDRLVGRATILNITDPFRDPQKTLHDAMWNTLGCVGSEKTYGLHCDLGKPTSSTVDGLSVQSYTVPYRRGTDRRPEASGTSTVWLVAIPANDHAWLYVYPVDFQNSTAKIHLESWINGLKRAP